MLVPLMCEMNGALTYPAAADTALVAREWRYILFHGKRHPLAMGASELTRYPSSLAVEGNVAASTQNLGAERPALPHREVLEQEVPWLDDVGRARRPVRRPVVLTREEVRAVLRQLRGTPRLMALLYGSGLRLLECARLRVKDVDFGGNQIIVRAGKGDKDRTTTLPTIISAELARHLDVV
jgi:integrase